MALSGGFWRDSRVILSAPVFLEAGQRWHGDAQFVPRGLARGFADGIRREGIAIGHCPRPSDPNSPSVSLHHLTITTQQPPLAAAET